MRLVLAQGLGLTLVGLAVGLGAAIATARLLDSVLFEVQPVDAGVYAAVALMLTLVAVAAGYLPARRASALDPAEMLKAE